MRAALFAVAGGTSVEITALSSHKHIIMSTENIVHDLGKSRPSGVSPFNYLCSGSFTSDILKFELSVCSKGLPSLGRQEYVSEPWVVIIVRLCHLCVTAKGWNWHFKKIDASTPPHLRSGSRRARIGRTILYGHVRIPIRKVVTKWPSTVL